MTRHYAPVDPPIPRCPYCGKLSSSLSGLSTFRGQPKCDHRCRERAGDPPATDARDPYASLRRLSVELILTGSCPMTIQQQDSLRALLAERDALYPVPPASAPAATADSESHAACACPKCGTLQPPASPVATTGGEAETAPDPAGAASAEPPQRFVPNFGEQECGVSAVLLPMGSVEAIERLARDLIAFGYGMGEAPPRSSDQFAWFEKAEDARKALAEHVASLRARLAESERTIQLLTRTGQRVVDDAGDRDALLRAVKHLRAAITTPEPT